MSIFVVEGKLYINHSKNMNHFHKDSKDLVSSIITLGTNKSVDNTVFYDGVKQIDLGEIYHV